MNSSGEDAGLVEAVREFQQALGGGQAVDRDAFLARYPGLAEQLAPCLDGLLLLRKALPAQAAPALPPESGPDSPPLGDFRLLRELGKGGMGVVYEAEQISLGRRVALKVLPNASLLDARQLQRFRNEAAAAAALRHPHIVQVYGVGEARGLHYYAMQLVDGLSLAEFVLRLQLGEGADPLEALGRLGEPTPVPADTRPAQAREGPPSTQMRSRSSATRREHFRRVAEWVRQAALGLDHAHHQGVVHRDVKPGNLLLDRQGWLFVADFGL